MGGTLRTGARFVLKQQASEQPLSYLGQVEEPEVTHEVAITFSDGLPVFGEWSSVPPEWAADWLSVLARKLGRTAVRNGTWPRKVRQWKAPADA